MKYAEIKKIDIANGEGTRVSLFVSGCKRHCGGCFNPQAWDFNFGKEFTMSTQNEIIEMLKPSYIHGLSLLGGEPFEAENQKDIYPFLKKIKQIFPNKDIWCFTGYTFEELIKVEPGRVSGECMLEMLSMIDVLVDGEFIDEQKDIRLRFRGSKNQRIIDVKKSLKNKQVVLYSD